MTNDAETGWTVGSSFAKAMRPQPEHVGVVRSAAIMSPTLAQIGPTSEARPQDVNALETKTC